MLKAKLVTVVDLKSLKFEIKKKIVEIIENIQFKAAKGLSLSVFLAGGGKNSLNLASENLSSLIFL
jgi:ABC-type dipeptide/oligopeptide/nickel transport system ATPase subunit